MDSDQNNNKQQASFYVRLKKQYDEYKPITYQLDLISNQPKPKAAKLNIIIAKFISIFKWGMRQSYDNEEDRRQNYWSELNKQFHNQYEMGFVNQGYWDKPKNKLRKYFALLIYTKRIFTVLERIAQEMGYLYQNQQQKIKNFNEQIKCLSFMADGQYKIMGELITSYQQYSQKRRQEEKLKQLQRKQQQRKKQQEQKKRKQKQLQILKEKQQKQRIARQQEEKKRIVQQKILQANKKKVEQETRLITSDYIPLNYKAAFTGQAKKMQKSNSNKKLDLPNNLQNHGKMKNSEKLFQQRYKDQLQYFSYALKPQINDEDKKVCSTCKKNLKQGIYSLGGNQNFCYYTGKWYCNDDISQQRKAIPWKAIQKFDLSGYTVCKQANAELNARYQKPIIEIQKDNPIIKQNKTLYQFLVVKRQMHLIYDSICNLDIIEPLMKKCENYCLRINLFSMKNLYDIYHGRQSIRLQRDYQILSKHFYRCDICQKKKGYICPVCKDPVKIFPFEIKQTFGCSACRKLFHRKCIPSGQCKCRDQD